MRIRSFGEKKLIVGEGPIWDVETGTLLTVDIVGRKVVEFDPSGAVILEIETPEPVLAVSRDQASNLIVALSSGLFRCAQGSATLAPVLPFALPAGTRLNDGKIDQDGRLVLVGADAAMQEPSGTLFRIEHDGSVTNLAQGFTIGNGPCWSPDGTLLYVADSIARQIYAYDYAPSGALGNRRLFADTSPFGGIPDGATVDRDGRIWTALCGAGKILCLDPGGDVVRTIEMPTAWVSSVMFGGPSLDQLHVTSLDPASIGIPGDSQCGGLFVIDGLGATGLPEPRMAPLLIADQI